MSTIQDYLSSMGIEDESEKTASVEVSAEGNQEDSSKMFENIKTAYNNAVEYVPQELQDMVEASAFLEAMNSTKTANNGSINQEVENMYEKTAFNVAGAAEAALNTAKNLGAKAAPYVQAGAQAAKGYAGQGAQATMYYAGQGAEAALNYGKGVPYLGAGINMAEQGIGTINQAAKNVGQEISNIRGVGSHIGYVQQLPQITEQVAHNEAALHAMQQQMSAMQLAQAEAQRNSITGRMMALKDRAGNLIGNAGQSMGNAYNTAAGAVGNAYNNAAGAVGNAYNTAAGHIAANQMPYAVGGGALIAGGGAAAALAANNSGKKRAGEDDLINQAYALGYSQAIEEVKTASDPNYAMAQNFIQTIFRDRFEQNLRKQASLWESTQLQKQASAQYYNPYQ